MLKLKNQKKTLDYSKKGDGLLRFFIGSSKEHGYTGFKIIIYFFKRPLNYFLHLISQYFPYNNIRVILHKARGVNIDKKVEIGMNVWIDESFPNYVYIHESASIALGTKIIAHSIPHKFHTNRFQSYVAPVSIEKGAWIGANSTVLAGVTIGEGSVVTAGSVITKNIPSYSIARGNPAEIVGKVRMMQNEKEKENI